MADLDSLKESLRGRMYALARELAPQGKQARGNIYQPLNPVRGDKDPGSFSIYIGGPKVGKWTEFASGDGGGPIDLIMYLKGMNFADAVRWAEGWLGLPETDVVAQDWQETLAVQKKAQTPAQQSKGAADWFAKGRAVRGTLAQTYLESRGCDFKDLNNDLAMLRYFARLKHTETGDFFPCMMAALTTPTGKIAAVHRTFLRADGRDKADVKPCRKMWPDPSGAVIRLAKGQQKHLVLCEGVEDGLSIAAAVPELAVWAVGALFNLAKVRLPQVERATVFVDNDWGNRQAIGLLRRGMDNIRAQAEDVRIASSPLGKDANDALMGFEQKKDDIDD